MSEYFLLGVLTGIVLCVSLLLIAVSVMDRRLGRAERERQATLERTRAALLKRCDDGIERLEHE